MLPHAKGTVVKSRMPLPTMYLCSCGLLLRIDHCLQQWQLLLVMQLV